MEFLENKSIFVIGALGFLGKILVEKILRLSPNVKKLYLLLRSGDEITATKRFFDEVVEKELFRVLKEKWGEDLNTLISEKIYLVPGDISCPNMGVKDSNLLEEMKNRVQIIVNLAATTKFNERYDVAFGTNTLGVEHVLNFAKQCHKLEIIAHVSTGEIKKLDSTRLAGVLSAFVSNKKEGLIPETPCKLDESLNCTSKLDIETEQKIIEETLKDIRNNRGTPETIALAMIDLGLKRAKIYGWPNTYVFTKAMGEMVANNQRDNLPLIIIRPTIVTSTYKEPFPGWIEGLRTIDTAIVGYAKGKLTCFIYYMNSILDLIPADMVINAIMMAIVTHKLESSSSQIIYHVGSSMRNSVRLIDFYRYVLKYFTENPCINEDGNAVEYKKVTVFNNTDSFRRYMNIYWVFLKGLEFANKVFCYSFQDMYNDLQRKFRWAMREVELYGSFLFFEAKFDGTNSENLRITTRDNYTNTLSFDPRDINWEDYFLNIHIPGLIKHVMK